MPPGRSAAAPNGSSGDKSVGALRRGRAATGRERGASTDAQARAKRRRRNAAETEPHGSAVRDPARTSLRQTSGEREDAARGPAAGARSRGSEASAGGGRQTRARPPAVDVGDALGGLFAPAAAEQPLSARLLSGAGAASRGGASTPSASAAPISRALSGDGKSLLTAVLEGADGHRGAAPRRGGDTSAEEGAGAGAGATLERSRSTSALSGRFVSATPTPRLISGAKGSAALSARVSSAAGGSGGGGGAATRGFSSAVWAGAAQRGGASAGGAAAKVLRATRDDDDVVPQDVLLDQSLSQLGEFHVSLDASRARSASRGALPRSRTAPVHVATGEQSRSRSATPRADPDADGSSGAFDVAGGGHTGIGEREGGTEMPAVPLDYSLRTRCRVASRRPLEWAKLPGAAVSTAAASPEPAAKVGPVSREDVEAIFARSTACWAYPLDPLPTGLLDATAGAHRRAQAAAARKAALRHRRARSGQLPTLESDGAAMFAERLRLWRAALRSVFLQTRTGACRAFWMRSRNHCVMFRGGSAPVAVVSPTTRGLRKLLVGADVPFSMPMNPACVEAECDGDAAWVRELTRLGCPTDIEVPSSVSRVASSEDCSAVVVRGVMGVQGLYEFLLNDFRASGALCDVPQILAPRPFVHAALLLPKVSFCGKLNSKGDHDVWALHLDGVLLPGKLRALCAALARLQRTEGGDAALRPGQHSREAKSLRRRSGDQQAAGEGSGGNRVPSRANGSRMGENEVYSAQFELDKRTRYFGVALRILADAGLPGVDELDSELSSNPFDVVTSVTAEMAPRAHGDPVACAEDFEGDAEIPSESGRYFINGT